MIKYYVSQPQISGAEVEAVVASLNKTRLTQGANVQRFEELLGAYLNIRHVIACSSGTTALHLALVAAGIGPGDEVLVPDLTYVATANAVVYTGATPVFVDVDPYTWNIDLALALEKITPKTKAILVVHLYGTPCNMEQVLYFGEKHGLKIIEDAAEALGGHWCGKPCGTFGLMGTFSFYANKVITTGEGGAVVTNDDGIAEKLRLFRGQGQSLERRFYHEVVGFNYRMTDIQAAIGIEQIKRIHSFLIARQHVVGQYRAELFPQVSFPLVIGAAPWLFTAMTPFPYVELEKELLEKGIETRPVFVPMHWLPMYQQSDKDFPWSIQIATHGISLPTYPGLRRDDVAYIAQQVSEVINARSGVGSAR